MSANTLAQKEAARYRVVLVAEASHPAPIPALRMILKSLLRRHRFRCISIGPEPRRTEPSSTNGGNASVTKRGETRTHTVNKRGKR